VIRRRGGGWLLFVDFSKAYDSVNRASLLLILRRMGFNREFIAFVKTALRPYKVFSESLGVSIGVERGVPQGWSLSCVLFNLVLDPLLHVLSWAMPDLFQSAFAIRKIAKA